MFDALGDVQYTKAPLPQSAGLLKPGLEKDYDVMVRYDMVAKFSPEQEKALVDLLHRGIGLVALHHNLGAHPQWDEYTKIIGGKYCFGVYQEGDKKFGPSTYEHDQDIKVAVADREHPITRGLADFAIHDEVYNHCYVAPDVHVLLPQIIPRTIPRSLGHTSTARAACSTSNSATTRRPGRIRPILKSWPAASAGRRK